MSLPYEMMEIRKKNRGALFTARYLLISFQADVLLAEQDLANNVLFKRGYTTTYFPSYNVLLHFLTSRYEVFTDSEVIGFP